MLKQYIKTGLLDVMNSYDQIHDPNDNRVYPNSEDEFSGTAQLVDLMPREVPVQTPTQRTYQNTKKITGHVQLQ